jgi:ribonucleoside-diphosphate reductase alpha chain
MNTNNETPVRTLSTGEYVWLNDASQRFLEMDYLLPGQRVDDRVWDICNRAEEILRIPGWAGKFKAYFEQGFYSFSSPVWANFAHTRGLPISCFGSDVNDSVKSIGQAHFEAMMMSKYGGGTSTYLGNLRPRGTAIKDNGTTAGAVNFTLLFDTMIRVISQGSTRRGQCAVYLPIEHGDIMEFLQLRKDGHEIQQVSYGRVRVRRLHGADDRRRGQAREVWAALLTRATPATRTSSSPTTPTGGRRRLPGQGHADQAQQPVHRDHAPRRPPGTR